jgi:hypothetical protein
MSQVTSDSRKSRGQAGTDGAHDANSHDRDQRGDQTVLDSGDTGPVFNQPQKKRAQQDTPRLDAFAYRCNEISNQP